MAAGVTIDTVNQYLVDRKALFHERGLQWVWNELASLAAAAASGYTGTVGALAAATLTPDFVELGQNTGRYDNNGAVNRKFLTGFRS